MTSETAFQTPFYFQFHCSKVRFYKPCTSGASESESDHTNRILRLKSRRASLYSVKVIKMSWLAIDRLLILWSLRYCQLDRETNCTTFLSLDTQAIERRQRQRTRNSFLSCLSVRVITSEIFCLHLTEITPIVLIKH